MLNLVVFAVIGLLAGASARMLYPRRQPSHILGTMAMGVIGGVLGGVISWANWPEVENQFQAGNLIVSVLGALAVITIGASISYVRGVSGYRNTTR
jgi:uncharacterized membrane protein YeaQ/YmgE (transglycosylase-associated protein family)